MNIKLKVLTACLMVGLFGTNAFAIHENAGTDAAAFLKIDAGSPRAQALGNAYVSIADGPEALFWNPAGAASATIAAQILSDFEFRWPQIISLLMSALAAGLTVGGKAVGKGFAVNSCTQIVHTVGKLIHTWNHFPEMFRKKKK